MANMIMMMNTNKLTMKNLSKIMKISMKKVIMNE